MGYIESVRVAVLVIINVKLVAVEQNATIRVQVGNQTVVGVPREI